MTFLAFSADIVTCATLTVDFEVVWRLCEYASGTVDEFVFVILINVV